MRVNAHSLGCGVEREREDIRQVSVAGVGVVLKERSWRSVYRWPNGPRIDGKDIAGCGVRERWDHLVWLPGKQHVPPQPQNELPTCLPIPGRGPEARKGPGSKRIDSCPCRNTADAVCMRQHPQVIECL